MVELDAFLRGVLAGYGIAIPIGPIALLILELGISRGFWTAFSAGIGAASADLIYATVAVLAGTFLVNALSPFTAILRFGSGLGLIGIGAWLLYQGRRQAKPIERSGFGHSNLPQTYGMVLGLTLLNPLTVTYFTTLILGMGTAVSESKIDSTLFVSGAFLASLSWQSFLASISGLAHRHLAPKFQTITFAAGNLVVIGLGLIILLGTQF